MVEGNTWDYSRYLRNIKKNKKKLEINYKYAVFLANSGPKYPSDSNLYKTKVVETVKNWYGTLDKFFYDLEEKFQIKVIIASHPKSKFEKKIPYLGNRLAYENSSMELVKNCKYVITSVYILVICNYLQKTNFFHIYK